MKQIIFYILVFSTTIYAQKHDNIWFVGHGFYGITSAKLDFTAPMLVDTINRNMPMFRSSVSMSDSLGNLQFYTNSIYIHNAQYQLMQNGDNLNPGQIANDNAQYGYAMTEGSIAIPHPKQYNKYYLFHQSTTYASAAIGLGENLYYTLIDMNANNGLGRVEKKNQLLISDSICSGQLEMVRHGNGKDWWLIQALGGSDGFYKFLITEDTIILMPKQYIGNSNRFAGWEVTGQAVFSPDGTKYARYDYKNDLDIFDFDRCTGLFSNPLHIAIQDSIDNTNALGGCGVAISPSNQFLYVASLINLYQFDLWATNIAMSKDTVAISDGFYPYSPAIRTIFGFLQLAPDNKIYGYANSTGYLHIIDSPDVFGDSCGTQQHALGFIFPNGHFIPNFPHYRTPVLAGSPCDTLTNTIPIPTTTSLNINLYPNPANTNITLESSTPLKEGTIVEIYNTIGQVLFQQKISQETAVLELDIRSLIDGVYIVQIQKDRQMVSKIFIVSKK